MEQMDGLYPGYGFSRHKGYHQRPFRSHPQARRVPFTGGPSRVCPRSSREKGSIGEEIARKYLTEIGFTILDANFHARAGEIDIVARGRAVFVEVKTAMGTTFETRSLGPALEAAAHHPGLTDVCTGRTCTGPCASMSRSTRKERCSMCATRSGPISVPDQNLGPTFAENPPDAE